MKAWRIFVAVGCLTILLSTSLRGQAISQQPASAPAAEDLSQFQTADDLWAHIHKLQTTRVKSHDEIVAKYGNLAAAAAEFQNRYPTDLRHWDARLIAANFKCGLDRFKTGHLDTAPFEAEAKSIAAAPDAPKDVKADARFALIQLHAMAAGGGQLTPDLDQEMLSFIHDFPQNPSVPGLQKMRLTALEKSDPSKAGALEGALLNDPNPAVVKLAQGQQRVLELTSKPLEMKFTALDGSQVDLSKLRGKVVLIDFWATWCGPCMAEVPEVVRTYNELHAKGLEIVGISLDQDKDRVETVTKEKGMVWPQYFDGKGWQNEIATTYGIRAIPHMWLVNKQGIVADPDVVRGTLPQQVQKLLEE